MLILDALEQPNVAATISVFIMLSFAVALYLSYKNWKENPSVFIISATLFVNFFIANNALYEFLVESKPDIDFYLRWVQYDSITIIATIVAHYICKVKHHKITSMLMYFLSVNICMYLALHIDIIENGNREPWWLWTLYTPVVNCVELVIAFSIIIYSKRSLKNNQETRV